MRPNILIRAANLKKYNSPRIISPLKINQNLYSPVSTSKAFSPQKSAFYPFSVKNRANPIINFKNTKGPTETGLKPNFFRAFSPRNQKSSIKPLDSNRKISMAIDMKLLPKNSFKQLTLGSPMSPMSPMSTIKRNNECSPDLHHSLEKEKRPFDLREFDDRNSKLHSIFLQKEINELHKESV
jgi:hypothetical protein